MKSIKNSERLAGVLFLIVFIIGVLVYQFLRGPVLFSDDYLINASKNSNQINISILLSFLSGFLSIIISIILFSHFKQHSTRLAYLYIIFCVVSFIAIAVENYSAFSLLKLSNEYLPSDNSSVIFFKDMGEVLYKNHLRAHYVFLLISCFPVFVLYYTLLYAKLIPKVISVFGLIAVLLMFTEILFSLFGASISMNLLMPIGLIQLFLPFWFIIRGFR